MILPTELSSPSPPSETLLPNSAASPLAIATPRSTAIATPARNASDRRTARSVVMKMIADMICGPAIIVMASGRI
jgi:hypothetical protein